MPKRHTKTDSDNAMFKEESNPIDSHQLRRSQRCKDRSSKAHATHDTDEHIEPQHTLEHTLHIEPQHFELSYNKKTIICERRGSGCALIFTHGAGGGLTNLATRHFADGFAQINSIVCYQGNMNMTSRTRAFAAVIENEGPSVALGGRSMGARAAIMSRTAETKAFVLVSYPLIGAKNQDHRDQILLELGENHDVLFVVGDKDGLCPLEELNAVREQMTARTWLLEIQEGANHSMEMKGETATEATRKHSGRLAAEWLQERIVEKRYSKLSWVDNEICHEDWHEPLA